MEKRYLISFYKIKLPQMIDGNVTQVVELQLGIIDVPVEEFIMWESMNNRAEIVPLWVKPISLSTAAEMACGGAGVQSYYIRQED